MEKVTKDEVDSFIESLIKQGFSFKELKESLKKHSELTDEELAVKLDELNHKFHPVYTSKMKKSFITFFILSGITIILIVLYQYFEHEQNKFLSESIQQGKSAPIGNGQYLTSGNFDRHRIFGNLAGWTGLIALISLIYAFYFFIKRTLILKRK